MKSSRTARRTAQRPIGVTVALALCLTLGACDSQTPAGPTTPAAGPTTPAATTEPDTTTAPTTTSPTTTSAATTTAAPTTAAPTQTEDETTTAPTETVNDIWAPTPDDGDDSNGAEAGPEIDRTKDYLLALVSGEHAEAGELLSAESRDLLGLEADPHSLDQEPWLRPMIDNLTSEDARANEVFWSSYPAWEGADDDTRVVTVRGVGLEGREFYYAFGARQVDDEWVVDQDRIDTGTGRPWALFLNPTMDGTLTPDPLSFVVTNGAGQPQDVTLRVNGFAEPRPLLAQEREDGVVYSEEESGAGMPGSYVALVTGHGEGDAQADMVRAHTVTFVVTESEG